MERNQSEANERITEYHCCDNCTHKFSVPADAHFSKWVLTCRLKRSELNPAGGLTRCPVWKEDI